jgi:hypothetical protein
MYCVIKKIEAARSPIVSLPLRFFLIDVATLFGSKVAKKMGGAVRGGQSADGEVIVGR